jgi:hypothetical protein
LAPVSRQAIDEVKATASRSSTPKTTAPKISAAKATVPRETASTIAESMTTAPPTTASTMTASKTTTPKAASRETLDVWKSFDDTPSSSTDDWSTSFAGLGIAPFSDRAIQILGEPLNSEDVEITPDGLLFLPEIKYRRVLNRAFGPGGWGLAPRSKTEVTGKTVTREYALICMGRLVAVARGEQDYFNPDGITTAIEGCKSNAMMRCCKDLGIASELWDPVFINQFKKKYCEQKYNDKKRKYFWKRKDRD